MAARVGPPSSGSKVVLRATPSPPPPALKKVTLRGAMASPPPPSTGTRVVLRPVRSPPPPTIAGDAQPTASDNAVGWGGGGVIRLRRSQTKNSSKLI
jgi:hypothetical protein